MFKFLKKNNRLTPKPAKISNKFGQSLATLLLGKKTIDAEILEVLETLLINNDVGIHTVDEILESIKQTTKRSALKDGDALKQLVQQELASFLVNNNKLEIIKHQPFVILVIGVNGAGKTTTIGKLAKKLQTEGNSVMLAAGDTFRAAAIEQLQIWGQRNAVSVVAGKTGGDSAAAIFDAYQSAKAKKIDVLIADTSGRLHTQDNLMQELVKIKKVLNKNSTAPHEVMLVVDGTAGQNAVVQAKAFNKVIGLTGITITKLDGTAKGGIVFAISNELQLPIRYVGIGEGIGDLEVFNPREFTNKIFV